MKRFGWMRTAALAVVCLGLSWHVATAFGQFQSDNPRLHPCSDNCNCSQPNIPYEGYYKTTWRHWPGEQDLGEINPRAAVSEVVQTPQGYEALPPAKPLQQQKPQQPAQPQQQPQPSTTLPPLLPGTLQSPGGLLSPHDMPSEPQVKPDVKPEPKSNSKPETKSESKPEAKSEPVPPGAGLPASSPLQSSPAENKQLNEPLPLPGSNTEPKDKTSSTTMPRNMQSLAPETAAAGRGNPQKSNTGLSSDFMLANGAAQQPAEMPQNAKPAPADAGTAARNAGVVALATNVEPDRGVPSYGGYRAEPISATPANWRKAEVEPTGYAEASSPAKLMTPEAAPTNVAVDKAPAAMPTVAMGGYCPVELLGHGRWVQGDLRWSAVYEGRIYRFAGAEQRNQFLAASAQFAPVNSGNDTVLLVNENRTVAGLPAYCAVYNGRLFMFSSFATQAEFNNNPARYIPAK
jgi:YHS domain-containing protein